MFLFVCLFVCLFIDPSSQWKIGKLLEPKIATKSGGKYSGQNNHYMALFFSLAPSPPSSSILLLTSPSLPPSQLLPPLPSHPLLPTTALHYPPHPLLPTNSLHSLPTYPLSQQLL